VRSGEHQPEALAVCCAGRDRRRVRLLLCVLVVLIVGVCWQQGWIGRCLRWQIQRWCLPRGFAAGQVTVDAVVQDAGEEHPAWVEGVQITVSPAWLDALVVASPYPAILMPPGFWEHGLRATGRLAFEQEGLSPYVVPFVVQCQDQAGLRPVLQARFPADRLNLILRESFAEDWTERGEYLLGSYDLEQSLRFDALRIRSIDADAVAAMAPIVLQARATGRLRYRFQDGWVRARITARVPVLEIRFVLVPEMHPEGIGFDYRAQIEKLELQVDRMAPWLERRLAKRVRKSLERSLNRERKRARLARQRLPLWLPLALSVDIEIVNPPAADGDD